MNTSSSVSTSLKEWASLSRASRVILLACYFAKCAGLAALFLLFAVTGWPARIAMLAVWLVPDGFVFFCLPHLRHYLPGPLVTVFSMLLGMLPGAIAMTAAQAIDATPVVSKYVFVVVTAAVAAAVIRRTYKNNLRTFSGEGIAEQIKD